jgi:hypothetical protein
VLEWTLNAGYVAPCFCPLPFGALMGIPQPLQ